MRYKKTNYIDQIKLVHYQIQFQSFHLHLLPPKVQLLNLSIESVGFFFFFGKNKSQNYFLETMNLKMIYATPILKADSNAIVET